MLQKLDSLLKSRGISQTAFERTAILSANRISKWKNGQGEPSASEALRIARALGVSVEWLIDDGKDYPAPPESVEWERSVLDLIQALGLDKQEALRRLAGVISPPGAPVILTGQAAREAIAASEPTDEVPQVIIAQESKLPRPRKKA